MDKKKELKGRCACGNVNFKIENSPLFTQACHCKNCKLSTGSSFVIHTMVMEEDFKIRSDGMTGVDTSSKRYKKKITDISDTSWIYDLRPVDFEWKKTDKKDWGLIAEEVIKVKPELVGVENDLPEWINYERLIPILLKEIQEQNKRIEILENA